MFCGNHGVVCCYVCVSIDHKSCKDLHSITDDIDKLYNKSETEKTQGDLNRLLNLISIQQKRTDRLIEELNDSRKSAVQEVRDYRTEINQILDNIEAESIQELDRRYRILESELLEEKRRYDFIISELKKLHDDITNANKNRAQMFVCTNIGQQKSYKIDNEEKERESKRITSIRMDFVPVEELRKLVIGLTSLGRPSVTVSTAHSSLYKAKKVADIDIELQDDGDYCGLLGSCFVDDILLITDEANLKLKRVDISKLSVIESCELPYSPYGICSTEQQEVVVACGRLIQFVSIRDKLSLTRQFRIDHDSFGIGYNKDKLYITDWYETLNMYDMSGHLLQIITNDNPEHPLFQASRHIVFSDDGDMMFVTDRKNGLVCLTSDGNHIRTFKNKDIKDPIGICVDGRGNVFQADLRAHTITQFSQHGNKRGTVVKSRDCYPTSISFHQRLNRLVVPNQGNIVRVYELEIDSP